MNNSNYILSRLNEAFCNDIHSSVNKKISYKTSDIVYRYLWHISLKHEENI